MKRFLSILLLSSMFVSNIPLMAMAFEELPELEDSVRLEQERIARERELKERSECLLMPGSMPYSQAYESLRQRTPLIVREPESRNSSSDEFRSARRYSVEIDKTLMDKVLNDAPQEIKHIIKDIKKHGLQDDDFVIKKLLFVGPPGTGKTSLAQAIALDCGMTPKIYKGSMIANYYKKSGDVNLENIFEEALKNQPCAIIIDELQDILHIKSDAKNPEASMATSLWTLLDTCRKKRIMFIGSLNHVEEIPKQLLDRLEGAIIVMPLPDTKEIIDVIQFHQAKYKDITFDESINLKKLVSNIQSKKLSHRFIAAVVKRAVLNASRRDDVNTIVTNIDYDTAFDYVVNSEIKLNELKSYKTRFVQGAGHILSTYVTPSLPYVTIAFGLYTIIKGEIQAAEQRNMFNEQMAATRQGLAQGVTQIKLTGKSLKMQQTGLDQQIESGKMQQKGLDMQNSGLEMQVAGMKFTDAQMALQVEATNAQLLASHVSMTAPYDKNGERGSVSWNAGLPFGLLSRSGSSETLNPEVMTKWPAPLVKPEIKIPTLSNNIVKTEVPGSSSK